jgi:Leucine-rich repeat (LRR) protein
MVTGETGQGSESSMLEAAFEASFSMIDDNFNEQNDTMYPNDDDILGGSVVLEDQKEGLESIAEEDEEDDDELKPRTCQEAESDFFGRLMRGSRLRKQTSYSEESMQMEAIGTILDSVPEEQSKELSSRLFSDSIHESSRSAFKSIASLEPEGINCDEEMQMVESIGCESDAYEHEDVETNSRDLESEKPKRKQGDCCSLWFWIIVTVALVSVCTGLGIGLFFLGGSQSENDENNLSSNGTVPDKETETSAPGDVPSDPVLTNLTPEQLNVYNLLCPKLEDCTSLLNMFMPQGQAFDWLTNDKTANPDLNKMSDETKTQRYALATFYYATNGNYWTNKTGWLSSESECKWFSSTALLCDANGRLIALELDNNQVQGQLPFEISLLTSLKTISIQNPGGSRPFLNGSLPSSLGSTISLRSIDLSGNQFSGLIPSELGSLVNLESLDLSDNSLSGEIPPSFALLGKMTVFDISGNKLTGINTLFFEGKLTLSELNISRNRLEDLPPSTGRLLSLRTLNLAQNSFSTFPLEVTELLFLSSLDLSGNSITGQIPVHLGRMNALQNLNLSNNKFVGNIPVEIGNLVDMTESLNLSGNGLQGSIPSALGNLVSLQRLLLNGNQFGGSIPSELASLTEILEIRLDDNILTGQVPVALCQLYNKTEPMAFADCAELTLAECFNYCCKDVTGCTCRWESTDPFRCMA